MNNDRASKIDRIKIEDLIGNLVLNAIERRNSSLDSKEFLLELSDDEAKLTKGGITSITLGHRPIQFPTKNVIS